MLKMDFTPVLSKGGDSVQLLRNLKADNVDAISSSVIIDGNNVYWEVEGGTHGVIGRCEVQVKTRLGDRVVIDGIIEVDDN